MGRTVVDNQSNHPALNCKFSVKFLHPFDKQITIYPALYFEKDNDKVNFLHYSNNVVWQAFRSQISVAFSCSITSSQSGKFYLTMTTTTTLNFVVQKFIWEYLVEETEFAGIINISQLVLWQNGCQIGLTPTCWRYGVLFSWHSFESDIKSLLLFV